MARWQHKVALKHLLSEDEDLEGVQKAMNSIADEVEKAPCFAGFSVVKFRSIPKGDEIFGPVDYANHLLIKLYNYADAHGIWID